jgi:hypothetical protein
MTLFDFVRRVYPPLMGILVGYIIAEVFFIYQKITRSD